MYQNKYFASRWDYKAQEIPPRKVIRNFYKIFFLIYVELLIL